jgi:LAS seventeen-binding protein 5
VPPVSRSVGSNKRTSIFKGTFADEHLTDALRNIANDPHADKRVRKKLILVLGSWHNQFSSDPSMTLVAGLFIHLFKENKPKVLASIVDGSQASSNLVDAITVRTLLNFWNLLVIICLSLQLVNRANDSLETNTRVQECLTAAKQAKKLVARYIQVIYTLKSLELRST